MMCKDDLRETFVDDCCIAISMPCTISKTRAENFAVRQRLIQILCLRKKLDPHSCLHYLYSIILTLWQIKYVCMYVPPFFLFHFPYFFYLLLPTIQDLGERCKLLSGV